MSWKDTVEELSKKPAYQGGISASEVTKHYNINIKKFANLQSNENLFVPSSYLKSIFNVAIKELDPRLYPKDEPTRLEEALASYTGVKPDSVLLGSGADQLMDLLISLFGPHGGIAYPVPTYSYYGISATLRGIKTVEVPYLKDFSMNIDKLIAASPSITFVCTPNNPTGHAVNDEQLKELIERSKGLVVVDETYTEFLGKSFASLIDKYNNLIILRTMSKSFGIASLRVGYLLANANLTLNLKKAQLPFVVSTLGAIVSINLLQKLPYFKSKWMEAQNTMKKFLNELEPGVARTPTATYFVTISTCKPNNDVYVELLKYGYITRIIRPFMDYKNPIRLSVAPYKMISNLPYLINGLSKC
ncbi:MAG: aminotransferase class I/II-fold pyridoxal phosphate-dependent enzyme [Nitrososphaerota archaeon]|nr:aminotransferase class I/II-fold pyridoxal phosphate-dependent enzyme [Nitrososphaerota archaeon]MDG6927207.1 aminotransferase class I/II-fold pyridoxal phosphate-dependent enzyme [Nitrososphaerota archaeon]MDG6929735.1 aminotransferase class I/II-fold pyridoxal phosphate-dependent enzyme [Nitrososphaerota archaeon]MDG6932650.1 aminotransferase class I/II-fold pyridoxal phosphate-dependent enzyme [Nitrososphaerota archaeon]MDG6936108.1 aminotransferase class I/II-fold pyridoxal phosphate-dep